MKKSINNENARDARLSLATKTPPAVNSRLTWLGKERDAESGLGDHGVRKYDNQTGRFTAPDPLYEKYINWTPYQYAMNNPVSFVDVNGKEIHVYSERVTSSTLSKGAGSNVLGFLANLFAPRHTFLQIVTDKVNCIIELGGPKQGTTTGNLIITPVKAGDNINNGRTYVKEHEVQEPKEKNAYDFENKILAEVDKIKNNPNLLPIYDGPSGPNSNSFIEYLISSNGGKLAEIPGAYGQYVTAPYYIFKKQ